MHIALGAYLLSGVPGYRQAGIHTCIKHLLEHLPAVDGSIQYTALVSPTAINEATAAGSRVAIRASRFSTEVALRRIVVEQIETARIVRALKPDIYHGLAFALPITLACPGVVTLYDLSFITQPRAHKVLNRTYLRLMGRLACQRARRIITISEFTKQEVIRHFKIDDRKISATPLGVTPDFARATDAAIAAFKRAKNINAPFIFFLGSIEPRKNIETLINAFALIDAADHPSPTLVIGGSPGWKYDAVFKRAGALGLADRVRFVGRVPPAELPMWYSACDAFAYPSLYEGFGLPPLEAMACGAAVVASDATSLPEVIGDAGLTAPPTDAPALAAALTRVLTNANLRAQLGARAIQRASQFTWQRTAERTVDAYRDALA